MKIAIFSDSHGRMEHMVAAMEEEQPDYVFFLGDNLRDGRELSKLYPKTPMKLLRGNCDFGPGPDELVVELEGCRFLLVHGHLHGAKSEMECLAAAGRQVDADMVCFGHTHHGANLWNGTRPWLFNPGTVGGIRERPGYGIVEVQGGSLNAWLK